jgi:hypothetical protein
MFSLIKNLFILVALIVTIVIGYYLYVQRNAALLENQQVLDVTVEAAFFLSQLNELKKIELDTAVLGGEKFTSLQTFSNPVTSEEIGRPNPFIAN